MEIGNKLIVGRHATAEIDYKNSQSRNESFFNDIAEIVDKTKIVELEEIKEPEHTRDGVINRYGFTTESGYSYSALFGQPKEQTTDTPVMFTSAWLTSTEGHNERTARNFMRIGNPVVLVGAEGSWHKDSGCKDYIKPPPPMVESAAADLAFGKYVSDNNRYTIHDTDRVLVGESRGAMVAMGMLALDSVYNQDIKFADLTAPCFPRKFSIFDVPSMAAQALEEPKAIAKLFGQLTMRRLVHYPGTVDLSPKSFVPQLSLLPVLLSGEAGELAELVDDDKKMHITCFRNDLISMQGEWERIFARNKNVRITPLEGSHLSLVDPETVSYVLSRNLAYQEVDKSLDDTHQAEYIFNRAHLTAPEILEDYDLLDDNK